MTYVIPIWIPPALPVAGSSDSFPVRRIFCVGANYAEHQREMGADGRATPFFFSKSAHALVPGDGPVEYPLETADCHFEPEMVVAIGRRGRQIPLARAHAHVFGYGVGFDVTRRDLQRLAKQHGRPWLFAKDFEGAAPCSELHRASTIGHPVSGTIRLEINGEERQRADLSDMIWSVSEQIVHLSRYYTLEAGDLIYTGTPAGVCPVRPGDDLRATVEGVARLCVTVVAST